MKVKSKSEVAQSCLTLSDPMGYSPTRLLCPWDFPGKSTGVGCHCLLRIIIQYYFIHFVAQTYSDLVIGNCFRWLLCPFEASLVAHTIKSLPVVQETQVRCLGWEDPLEKGMATHSSILAWEIT